MPNRPCGSSPLAAARLRGRKHDPPLPSSHMPSTLYRSVRLIFCLRRCPLPPLPSPPARRTGTYVFRPSFRFPRGLGESCCRENDRKPACGRGRRRRRRRKRSGWVGGGAAAVVRRERDLTTKSDERSLILSFPNTRRSAFSSYCQIKSAKLSRSPVLSKEPQTEGKKERRRWLAWVGLVVTGIT